MRMLPFLTLLATSAAVPGVAPAQVAPRPLERPVYVERVPVHFDAPLLYLEEPLAPLAPAPLVSPADLIHLEQQRIELAEHAFDLSEHRALLAEARAISIEDRARGLAAAAPIAFAPSISAHPPQAWAPNDPADSAYRVAREALNRTEYRRAAQLFREVRERHPRSVYVSESAYYEAFALYRIGTTDDLRTALRVLDQQTTYQRKETQANAAALSTRVLGALARRGDPDAQRRVAQVAQNGRATCDSEELMVRVEALNALTHLDQAAATPLLRSVLARRDECSASLRRSAVMLVSRHDTPEGLAMLGEVAASDPNATVRSVAVSHIGASKRAEAPAVLEGMLRSSDESVRRAAARGLVRRTDDRSRRAVRAYLESPQTSESQKAEVIMSFQKESSSPEDVAFLRTLYGRTDSERVRSTIISTMPRLAPDDTRPWLLSIARNGNEPTASRAAAIMALSREASLPVAELSRIYDAANERRIREQVVGALARRTETEATDKLIDIARNGTDPVVRSAAIHHLSRRKDPRLAALLQELIVR